MTSELFIDSGAPTLYNSLVRKFKVGNRVHTGSTFEDRKNDDFSFLETEKYKEYRQAYCDFLIQNQKKFEVMINLDIINNSEATWENQLWFESKGLKVVPVFHFGCDPIWLEKYMKKGYKYIALGGLHPNPYSVLKDPLDEMWIKYWLDRKGYPKIKVHGFAVTGPKLIYRYPWYCMTEEDHEVFTKQGWKFKQDLKIGDEILAFNDGVSKWEKIEAIPEFMVQDEEITHLYNRNFEAYVTANHRWKVCNWTKTGRKHWKFKTTETLKGDKIPRVGNYNFPKEKVYTDEQVELMGWYWTDGTINPRPRYKDKSITIYQSKKANPEKCLRIEKVLQDSNEKYCKCKPTSIGLIAYEMYGEITKWLLETAPNKKLSWEFLFNLTKEQMKLFLEISMLGDGNKTSLIRKEGFAITVKRPIKKENLEKLRIGYLLLGIATSVFYSKNNYKGLNTSSVDYIYGNKVKKESIKYTGKLWCVQVQSKAFYTRCRDKIYVTGNSVDSTSWVKLGLFGCITVPKQKYGKPDYKTFPMVLFVSARTTEKYRRNSKHIDSMSKHERDTIEKFINSKGFKIGQSEIKKVDLTYSLKKNELLVKTNTDHKVIEIIKEIGLSNDNVMRDTFNALYYQDLAKSVPKWPWKVSFYKDKGLFA